MNRKRVLITGASSGIGQQLANDYLLEDWEVIACGRNSERLMNTNATQHLQFDIQDRQETIANSKEIEQPLDLIILNAGTCEYIDDVQSFDSTLFERVIRSNVIGLGNCIEALLPHLKADGQIALMGSAATLLPFSRAQAYGASKAAVTYLSRSLQVDLKHQGINVCLIQPGFVKTPLTDKNDFDMPGMISMERASDTIRQGLKKRKSTIVTPWLFNRLLGLLGALPDPLPTLIATKLRRA